MSYCRARHTVIASNHSLYVFGGWNGKKKLNDIVSINLDTFRREIIHDSDEVDKRLPNRRECHAALCVNNTMYIFGGRFRGFFMNDLSEFPLPGTTLRDMCRFFINESGIDYDNARWGLPSHLVDTVHHYAALGLCQANYEPFSNQGDSFMHPIQGPLFRSSKHLRAVVTKPLA